MRAPSALLAVVLAMWSSCPAQAQRKTSLLPVLGAAPETGWQFGVAVMRTDRDTTDAARRPSLTMGNVVRTTKGQTRAFVDTDRWSPGNARRLFTSTIVQEFPLPFYGFGDGASEGEERFYTPRSIDARVSAWRKIAPALWATAGARFLLVDIVKADYVVDLGDGGFPPPPLGDGATASYADPFRSDAGRTVLASLGIAHDTRDNIYAPASGRYAEFTVNGASEWIGSEFEYVRAQADVRAYRRLGDAVLGWQGVAQMVRGHGVPFYEWPLVGNNTTMRGYVLGRFRDQTLLTTQAEYRTAPRGAWVFAAFGGVTLIARDWAGIGDARPLPSVGGGLRYRLDRVARSAVRVDYALGRDGQSGLYVAFNEAF